MRHASMLLASCLLIGSLPTLASAQSTRPSGEGGSDLARENAELRRRLDELQKYTDDLESKLRRDAGTPSRPRLAPGAPPQIAPPQLPWRQPFRRLEPPAPSTRPAPSPARPFGFQMPSPLPPRFRADPEYRFQLPAPGPGTRPGTPPFQILPAPAPGGVPDNWQRRDFNGQPIYVIPLE